MINLINFEYLFFTLMFATDMFVTYCVHVECIVLYYKICARVNHRHATHSSEIGRHTAHRDDNEIRTKYNVQTSAPHYRYSYCRVV